jgi:hypothetical protein
MNYQKSKSNSYSSSGDFFSLDYFSASLGDYLTGIVENIVVLA